jgi:hypothetical protein
MLPGIRMLQAVVLASSVIEPASTTIAASPDDLRVALDESRWCGREAALTFSIVNSGSGDVSVGIAPSDRTQREGVPAWSGNYRATIGNRGIGRAKACQATHGVNCVPETEFFVLALGATRSWTVPPPRLVRRSAARRPASLAIDVRLKPTETEFGELHKLSWSGVVQLSRMADGCWRAVAVQPAP